MRIVIDATNLQAGGGRTHLIHWLRALEQVRENADRVRVFAHPETLDLLPEAPWLTRTPLPPRVRGPLPIQAWRQAVLPLHVRRWRADVLFVPGGGLPTVCRPEVTMCRNMLPFEREESGRFGSRRARLRYEALFRMQSLGFRQADGVIFLTRYAADVVQRRIGALPGATAIVPHGVSRRFVAAPRPARRLDEATEDQPLRLLYVSIVNVYKHQWHVAEAVARLRERGWPVRLDLVGPATGEALARLQETLDRLDPEGRALKYHGAVPHDTLPDWYHRADAFVFASSCENLPNILLEAMAAGLPIACSDRGPMPEVLGEDGVYFDPEQPAAIERALVALLEDAALRDRLAAGAHATAGALTWERCAADTLRFLREVVGAGRAR